MADYNPQNLPGQPGYQWKAPPGYTGVSPQEQALAQGLGYGGPSQQFLQGTQGILQALQGGGYSAVKPYLGRLGKFAMGGKRMGEAYETAATKRLQQTGQAALSGIQAQMGGQGALGSTTHLGGLGDLAQRYGAERAQIGATAAQMGEQAMIGRLGAGIQGLTNLGQLASYEQMNRLSGGQALAGLGMGQQEMGQRMNLQQLAALQQQRMEPSQWGWQVWPGGGSPAAASGGGGILPYLGAAADIGTSIWSMGGFGGGGGNPGGKPGYGGPRKY